MNKIPVSKRALIQRINRKLRHEDMVLKKLRGERWLHELGEYYILDLRINGVMDRDVDLESYARKKDILAPSETVVD